MRMAVVCRVLVWTFERLLRFYPRRIREEFGPEMVWVFARSIEDAAGGGWGRLLAQSWRELYDIPGAILGAWVQRYGKRGLIVSESKESTSGRHEQERIRWASR
jgi:hypothetical protein